VAGGQFPKLRRVRLGVLDTAARLVPSYDELMRDSPPPDLLDDVLVRDLRRAWISSCAWTAVVYVVLIGLLLAGTLAGVIVVPDAWGPLGFAAFVGIVPVASVIFCLSLRRRFTIEGPEARRLERSLYMSAAIVGLVGGGICALLGMLLWTSIRS
jgi:hypothetical protein